MPAILANPLVGANTDRRTSVKEFALGTPAIAVGNKTYVYVLSTEPIAIGTCTVDASFNVTDAAGTYTADVAFLTGEYGWVTKTTSPL